MFRTFTLFKAFGIPVRVHGTLLVFLPILALMFGGGQPIQALLFLIGIFGCVLLHELGHSLAALYYKIPVRQITLYPLGGVAGIATMPESPKKELVITIAGPLVNFVLAPLFFMLAVVLAGVPAISNALLALAIANVVLGVFNLLPGFPMDGGRILRAILAMKMPYLRATQIAVKVGQWTAIAMGIFGLLSVLGLFEPNIGPHFMLIPLAVFIYFAAQSELVNTMMRAAQRGQSPGGMGGILGQILAAAQQQQQRQQQRYQQTHHRTAPPPPASAEPREGETFVIDRDSVPGTGPRRGASDTLDVNPDGTFRRS